MIRNVNLIDHLPPYIQKYREMQVIMNAENPDVQAVEDASEIVKNNMFVLHADEAGIERYERMLGLTPSKDDSLYKRQTRVLTYYANDTIYTLHDLIEYMDVICGAGNYTLELIPDKYTINIEVSPNDDDLTNTIASMLMNVLPANMVYKVVLKFNRHNVLSKYPTYLLEQFTHQELREERIDRCISNSCDNLTNYTVESLKSILCKHVSNFGMRKV